MVFRDQQLVCKQCGKTFFFTVTEQRRLAEELGIEEPAPPELCRECRQGVPSLHSGREPPAPQGPPALRERPAPRERPRQRVEPPVEPAVESRAATGTMDEFPLQIEGIEVKLIGKIKWYRPEKGYGFITKANGQDIFFHRASVVGSTSQLGKGRQVEFQIRQTPKGPEAFNVSVLPPV